MRADGWAAGREPGDFGWLFRFRFPGVGDLVPRAQVLLGSERALLLCYRQRRWYLEGSYE
ncbi:hypothetical protein ABH37_19980 [Mycobacterium haemophilum]|uniref:Uncharacterized protein n=1 Tax=Mycobacterium haemophilum TaxID=29311 RepID=A0A0I9TB84_9MYCO|nr:hypothetical protein ABH39_20030 [Mycobacterium haemophilum]KLO33980.1 hypothetical protein ABH38_20070 [Mycobacterium haemophilum]KLO35593.1 hypothetical protein ABH37_19980 [Mycobacterium haemophilum]KLO42769.1 hypothetical protein ABH36_20035 [Mycobacterium haemophilum]